MTCCYRLNEEIPLKFNLSLLLFSLALCTAAQAAPAAESEAVFLKDNYIPTSLNFKQFRADGYYLLALKGDIEKPAARDYFKQVQTLPPDCLDPMSLGVFFNAIEDKVR